LRFSDFFEPIDLKKFFLSDMNLFYPFLLLSVLKKLSKEKKLHHSRVLEKQLGKK